MKLPLLFNTCLLNSYNQPQQIYGQWKLFFSRLGIRNKIIFGYVLALTIACLGGWSARIVEDYYNEVVEEQVELVDETEKLLNDLKFTILTTYTLQYRLIFVVNDPDRLEEKSSKILAEIDEINRLVNEAKILLDEELKIEDVETKKAYDKLDKWLAENEETIEIYTEQMMAIMDDFAADNLAVEKVEEFRRSLASFADTEVSLRFGDLSEELVEISKAFRVESDKVHQAYEDVEHLESKIMIAGLLLAILVGTILAIITGRAIAHPLEVTTEVARRVTEESNFNLRAPVISEDEIGQLTTSLNDLIQRVAADIKKIKETQSQLIQSEKMSSLGRLVAGIAHEINNPVNFIQGNINPASEYFEDLLNILHLYQEKYPYPSPEIQDAMEEIDLEYIEDDLPKCLSSMRMGTERIRQIVLSLRIFSRLDEAGIKKIDIHEGIDSTLLLLNSLFENKIEIIKKYGNLPLVTCYSAQINQVFLNILSNAADALLSCEQVNHKQIAIATEVVTLERLQIRVRDNGSGIPTDIQDKIFDPFFTTKPVGKGTGLGLSICYEIIQKHGGEIILNSQPGEGTEFIVTLPFR